MLVLNLTKKTALVSLLFFLKIFVVFSLFSEPLNLTVQAEAAILMNAETGDILYEKNAYDLHYPASITKIATALIALKKAEDKLAELITADQDCVGTVTEEAKKKSNYTLPSHLLVPDSSHIGIKKGEIFSLKDLLYGMMIASGDDAANIVAKYVGGSIPAFVDEMNAYVRQLGCKHTTFYNPHGLHHPKQRTTAFDMAILTKEALKNPFFCELVSTVRYTRPKTNKQASTTLLQTNRLLRTGPYYYSKAIGVKTGYYSLAGSTLVAAATDKNRTLIAVLLKTQERKNIFQDAKKMFETAFNQPKNQRLLLRQGLQKFVLELPGADQSLLSYIDADVTIEYYPAEEIQVKCLLNWDKNLALPIFKNQKIGELSLRQVDGRFLQTIPLYAQNEVKRTWLYSIQHYLGLILPQSNLFKILGILILMSFLGFFIIQLKLNKTHKR